MPGSNVPTKTPQGHDELRHRTNRLGQRHRTILLLVDGRRPLSEVLSLAQKAGSATSYFEELVRLGLVEVHSEAAVPEPVETSPGALDVPLVTSVEVTVPAETAAMDEPQLPPRHDEVRAPPAIADAALPPESDSGPPLASDVEPPPVADASPPPESNAAPAASADVPPEHPLPRPLSEPAALPRIDKRPAQVEASAEPVLQQVRTLLIETLRLDAPLFSARTFVRVRAAQTAPELIELVWEIEQHLSHARHSRSELQSLQRARELLGLGNTLVAGDSQGSGWREE